MKEKTAAERVIERAKTANIAIEIQEVEEDEGTVKYHYILIPSGKNNRQICIDLPHKSDELLSFNFEKYSYLGDYDAIAHLEKGEIEAAITSRELLGSAMMEVRLGFPYNIPGENKTEELALKAENSNNIKLEISRETRKFTTMSFRSSSRASLSLKISLGKPQNHDSALTALEVISNALFFEIDMERSITLSLRRAMVRRQLPKRRSYRSPKTMDLQFPPFEYDSAPISLYWYAKSARGMPLLQFLAYYQVAEYYFPNFAKLEAIRNVRKILKNPTFRIDRESDLTRLISSISGNGRVGSSEREQMKATILEVLTIDDIAEYFKKNPDVAEIVSKKQKEITDKTININRKDHDHRPDIADLLYDIRCRIVHTKNDSENFRSEMLLPFSLAEDGLWAYVDLMQLVAQHALIRSSSAMRNF